MAFKVCESFGLLDVKVHDKGFFFFIFGNEADWDIVIAKGPWLFANRPLVLKKWRFGMKLSKDAINKILVWVNFYNVLFEYWTEEGLSCIASAVGKPLYGDTLTESRQRINFARIYVEMDAGIDWPNSFDLEFWSGEDELLEKEVVSIGVEHQWKPLHCRLGRVFGHSVSKCLHTRKLKETDIAKGREEPIKDNTFKFAETNQKEVPKDAKKSIIPSSEEPLQGSENSECTATVHP